LVYFAIVTDAGPAWNPSRARRDQDQWTQHAAFIDDLAAKGALLLVGPLSPTRALQIQTAPDEAAVRERLAQDPWVRKGILRILSIDPWEVLVGNQRLATNPPRD
jgi:uncharacterized protein YciI